MITAIIFDVDGTLYNETDVKMGTELGEFYWQVVYGNMKPYEDFLYILPRLQEKYRLYVLTDELQAIQERKLRRLGLEHAFIKAVSAEQIGATKPSEKCFQYMAGVIGEACKNILVVGDNPGADIRGGKQSGMHTAWLRRGKYHYYPRKPEEEPEIIFTNFIQLSDKIEALDAGR